MDKLSKEQEEHIKKIAPAIGLMQYIKNFPEGDLYSPSLFLLKLFFDRFYSLLSIFCSQKVFLNSPQINTIYINLYTRIESILSLPNFEELKGHYFRPFENLLASGDYADFDICWDHGYAQEYASIKHKIDEAYILNGAKQYETDKDLDAFLKNVDDFISSYAGEAEKAFENILEGSSSKQHAGANPRKQHSPQGEDVELDKNIVLGKRGDRGCLLLNRSGKTFQDIVYIRPQAYNIIHYLYKMRNRTPALSLQEFADNGLVADKKVISMRRKEINNICKKYGVIDLFHKYPEQKWGLNPKLGCCKEK